MPPDEPDGAGAVINHSPVLVDTSVLIDAFCGERRSLAVMADIIERGDLLMLTTVVVYQWRRGPRLPQEVKDQELLIPTAKAVPFEIDDALLSAELYKLVSRPRGREADLTIAACAIRRGARLWTLNPRDFSDIPRLQLFRSQA